MFFYYFRCDTPGCKMRGRSVRAKTMVDFAISYLSNKSLLLDQAYGKYTLEMKSVQIKNDLELRSSLNKLKEKALKQRKRIEQTKELLLKSTAEKDLHIADTFKADLKHGQEYLNKLRLEINKTEELIENNQSTILTYEKFIELFKNLANFIRKVNRTEDLDYIIKKVFLNFHIKDKKIANFTLNEPFSTLIKDDDFFKCRGAGN